MCEQITIKEEMKQYLRGNKEHFNLIIAELLLLLEDNNNFKLFEKQKWIQIMFNEVIGDSKPDFEVLLENGLTFETYIGQLIIFLVASSYIDRKTFIMLILRINDIFTTCGKARDILESLREVFNEQMDEETVLSINNDDLGIDVLYSNKSSFVIIPKVVSILNPQLIDFEKDGQSLLNTLEKGNIINDDPISFVDIAAEMMSLTDNEAGYLLLYFGSIRKLLLANIFEKMLLEYYHMSDKIRKMRKPRAIVTKILDGTGVNLEDTITSRELYEVLISVHSQKSENHSNNGRSQESSQEEPEKEETSKKVILTYIEEAKKIIKLVCKMVPSWNETEGNLYYDILKKRYNDFLYGIKDALDETQDIGISLHSSVCNLTFIAKALINRYSYLELDHVVFGDGIINVENMCINFVDHRGEDTYFSLADAYEQMLEDSNIKVGKKFDTEAFPRIISAMCLDHIGTKYIEIYDYLFDRIEARIDDNEDFLKDTTNIIRRFPIEYYDYYNDMLIRPKTSVEDIPHIKFWYPGFSNIDYDINEVTSVLKLPNYETLTIIVEYCNVPLSDYTATYNIIENDYTNVSSLTRGIAADIEWGEWVGENKLELLITKRREAIDRLINVEIKVCIKEYPQIFGHMQFVF